LVNIVNIITIIIEYYIIIETDVDLSILPIVYQQTCCLNWSAYKIDILFGGL